MHEGLGKLKTFSHATCHADIEREGRGCWLGVRFFWGNIWKHHDMGRLCNYVLHVTFYGCWDGAWISVQLLQYEPTDASIKAFPSHPITCHVWKPYPKPPKPPTSETPQNLWKKKPEKLPPPKNISPLQNKNTTNLTQIWLKKTKNRKTKAVPGTPQLFPQRRCIPPLPAWSSPVGRPRRMSRWHHWAFYFCFEEVFCLVWRVFCWFWRFFWFGFD